MTQAQVALTTWACLLMMPDRFMSGYRTTVVVQSSLALPFLSLRRAFFEFG